MAVELWLKQHGISYCGQVAVVVEQWRMCIESLYNVLIIWSDNKCVLI